MSPERNSAIYAYCLCTFFIGLVAVPLYMIFTVSLNYPVVRHDPDSSVFVLVVTGFAFVSAWNKIRRATYSKSQGYLLGAIGFAIANGAYFGCSALIMRTVFHWYVSWFDNDFAFGLASFGPALLLVTLPFAIWSGAKLQTKVTTARV